MDWLALLLLLRKGRLASSRTGTKEEPLPLSCLVETPM